MGNRMLRSMDVEAYLRRIGLVPPPPVTIDRLLDRAQPAENAPTDA
jgi:hypothetical protein